MKMSKIITKPNRPPIYDKVSSIFLNPLSTITVVLALLKTMLAKVSVLVGQGTTCPKLPIIAPDSSLFWLTGQMLQSVVIWQLEMNMLTRLAVEVVVNARKLRSQRQQVRYCGELGLMRVLRMNRSKWYTLLRMGVVSRQILEELVVLLHFVMVISAYQKSSDVNLPWSEMSSPRGGHSILEKFIRWQVCIISQLTDQCCRVQGQSATLVTATFVKFQDFLSSRLTSKYCEEFLKSVPEMETANINFYAPRVSVVTLKLSTDSSMLLSDQTISVLAKVPIITFMKMAQKVTTVTMEQKAPVQVRYSGSSSYLRNSEVEKISHLRKNSFRDCLQDMIRCNNITLDSMAELFMHQLLKMHRNHQSIKLQERQQWRNRQVVCDIWL